MLSPKVMVSRAVQFSNAPVAIVVAFLICRLNLVIFYAPAVQLSEL